MTIILIDPYPLQRLGMARFLGSRFGQYTVLEYDSLDSFRDQYKGEKPALIIWGIHNIDLKSGLDLLFVLRQRLLPPAVIIYDDKTDFQKALKYLKAGALGYFSRSDDLARLTEGIDNVLQGKRYVTKEVLDAMLEEQLYSNTYTLSNKQTLSKGEYEVAAYLVKGIKISFIAATLNKKISTISTYKHRIYKKLDVGNIIELKEKLKSLA